MIHLNFISLCGRVGSGTDFRPASRISKARLMFPLTVAQPDDSRDYVPVILWGELAESAQRSLTPGADICVEGRLMSWTMGGSHPWLELVGFYVGMLTAVVPVPFDRARRTYRG